MSPRLSPVVQVLQLGDREAALPPVAVAPRRRPGGGPASAGQAQDRAQDRARRLPQGRAEGFGAQAAATRDEGLQDGAIQFGLLVQRHLVHGRPPSGSID